MWVTLLKVVTVPLLLVGLWAPSACASGQQQQQQSGQSGQAGQGNPSTPVAPLPGSSTNNQSQNQEPVSPVATSDQTVTGAFAPHAEAAGDFRSSLVLGVHADEYVDSNVLGTPNTSDWLATTEIGGHLDLHRARETSDLKLSVSAGGLIYPGNSQYNSEYAAAGITDTIGFRRGSLVITDLFSYLPDSPLGFGGGGIGGIPGNQLSAFALLNPSVTPDQSILNLQTQRLSNEALAQGEWNSSARTAWTFTGGYGILHYIDSGFVQPSSFNFGIGYNRTLSPGNVIGFSDTATLYRFSPSIYSVNDNIFNVTYGRNLTRRLAFRIGVGPEIDTFTVQVGPTPGTSVSYNINGGLSYAYEHAQLQISGYRYVSGGSGILFGAETTGAQISASKTVAKRWLLDGDVGYNLNQSLSQTSAASSTYGSLFVTAGVSRAIGRDANLFVRYNIQHQTTSGPNCINAVCLSAFNRQEGFIGFSWDTRPFRID